MTLMLLAIPTGGNSSINSDEYRKDLGREEELGF